MTFADTLRVPAGGDQEAIMNHPIQPVDAASDGFSGPAPKASSRPIFQSTYAHA